MIKESNPARVDFHVHYNPDTITNLSKEAQQNNVVAMALVGREVIPNPDSWQSIKNTVEQSGSTPYIGVEVSREINGQYIDLIGIGFDPSNETIRDFYGEERILKRSAETAKFQEDLLSTEGFIFDHQNPEEEKELAELRSGRVLGKAIRYCNLLMQNPTNIQKTLELIKNNKDFYDQVYLKHGHRDEFQGDPKKLQAKFLYEFYFGPGRPGRLPTDAQLFIDHIQNAGGVVLISPEGDFNEDQYNQFLKMGGDGIMAWHGGNLAVEPKINGAAKNIPLRVIKKTRQQGKLVLGGSDYDPDKEDWRVGTGYNDKLYISARRQKELDEYLKEKQKNQQS